MESVLRSAFDPGVEVGHRFGVDRWIVQHAGKTDQAAEVEKVDVGVLPSDFVVTDAEQHVWKGALERSLRVILQLVLEVDVREDQADREEGNGVLVFNPVPVGHPEEIAEGLGLRSQVLVIQDSANDSVGLTGIVRPVGAVVGQKQEDGVVQGLLGDGVAVETGKERIPADDERSIRVVRHVKCLPHTISKDRITLVLFAEFCIRYNS